MTARAGTYIVRPDGTSLHLAAAGELNRFWWSPDGRKLAVVTSMCGAPTVWVFDLAAGSTGLLKAFVDLLGATVAWSSDSRHLLFAASEPADDDGWHSSSEVYLLDALGQVEPEALFRASSFSWSPDGREIAFVRQDPNSNLAGDLNVMRMDDRSVRTLARDSSPNGLAWSPDGRLLVYTGKRSEQLGDCLAVVNRDGTGHRVLADRGFGPQWLPDSERLVFVRITGELDFAVNMARWDDPDSVEVLADGYGGFDMSSDGSTIAVSRFDSASGRGSCKSCATVNRSP